MSSETGFKTKAGRLPGAYVALWAALSAGAAGYLAFVVLDPSVIGINPGIGPQVQVAQERNEDPELRLELSNARLEIAKLRTKLSQLEERTSSQNAAMRPGIGAPADPAELPAAQQIDAQPATAEKEATTDAGLSEAQIVNAAVSAPIPPAKTIETGSIRIPPLPVRAPPPPITLTKVVGAPQPSAPPPVIEFGVANVEPALPVARSREQVGVRLASGPSVDALRLTWNLLLDTYGPTLRGLEPRYVGSASAGALGPTYDLIAGPLPSRTDGERMCRIIRMPNGGACQVRSFTGNVL